MLHRHPLHLLLLLAPLAACTGAVESRPSPQDADETEPDGADRGGTDQDDADPTLGDADPGDGDELPGDAGDLDPSDGDTGDGDAGPSSCAPGHYGADCAACTCDLGGLCDDGIAGTGACTDSYALSLRFERVSAAGLDPVRAIAKLVNNGTAVTGATLTFESSRGSMSAVTERGAGEYEVVVTPAQTGEHAVAVSARGLRVARTALVLSYVSELLEQPMAVEGLVNTAGYEDGVHVSPDGRYLFVQTGPWRMSAAFLFALPRAQGGCGGDRLTPTRCTHPWLDTTLGPYSAPERPGFFDGRISGTTLLHNSALYGMGADEVPIFAPMTMFYGFARQPDGSYAEPFYVAFEDENDGIVNPFGISPLDNGDGTATIAFTLDEATDGATIDLDDDGTPDVQSGFDVYTAQITWGQHNILGHYDPGPVRGAFASTKVGFGAVGPNGDHGTQGNPHLYRSSDGGVTAIFTDDEYDADADAHDVSVYLLTSGTLATGEWTKTVLPDPVNTSAEEIQPHFLGDTLVFTRDLEIVFAPFVGAPTSAGFADTASWQATTTLLGKDSPALGTIIAVGEPTVASIDGVAHLFFVYVTVRGFDETTGLADLDAQAGVVRRGL